jgi:transcriptional regulator with XRE-family HTH domain
MNEAKVQYPAARIGKALRAYREKTGRYQSEVAREAGISTSMLSQIERAAVSPSIETLMAVCGALEVDMADLFRRLSPQTPVRIVSPAHRLRTEERGVRYEQLISSSDTAFPAEMFMLEVEPGKQIGLSGQGHEGVEMGLVLEGRARLNVDGVEHELNEGDSVCFSCHLPHTLRNIAGVNFQAVWTTLPPHTDYLKVGALSREALAHVAVRGTKAKAIQRKGMTR